MVSALVAATARTAASSLVTASLVAAGLVVASSCAPSPGDPALPDAGATDGVAPLDGICKTVAGAAPEVVVGQGQADYLALADLETVRVEAGLQGGHHI